MIKDSKDILKLLNNSEIEQAIFHRKTFQTVEYYHWAYQLHHSPFIEDKQAY